MKRSITIATVFTSIVLSSLAFVYALEGDIISPADGGEYTLGTPVHVSFESVPGNAYLGYVCPATVDVTGLSGTALTDHFNTNGCTQVYNNTATDVTTDVYIDYAAGHIQSPGNYTFHVVGNNGCILNQY